MSKGNSSTRRKDTREMTLGPRLHRTSNTNEFSRYHRIFGDENLTRLVRKRTKTELRIKRLKEKKEEIESKETMGGEEVKKYQNIVAQLDNNERELNVFKKELSEGICLYLSLPLRIVMRSEEISKDLVNGQKIEKEKVLERINKNIDFPSEKIKENFINTTYNVTLDLVEKIRRYRTKRDKIESKYERKSKILDEMKEMSSNYTALSIKGLELALTMGSIFGLNYINRVNKFIDNLNPNEIIFYIIPAAFTISNLIDKVKKMGIRIYRKIITKKKEKKASELREEFRESKKKMLISLYANVSENIFIYLEEKINTLKRKNVIDEEEYKHYKELINKNIANDKNLIEQKAETIEKEL
jgi:hypothetical protein